MASGNEATHPASTTQPWTATRCHRLLRPLLAHIAALRKEKALRALKGNEKPHRDSQSIVTARKRSHAQSVDGVDNENATRKKRRKILNTYTSRASRKRVCLDSLTTPQPQRTQARQRLGVNKASPAFAVPTPFLRRVRDYPDQPFSPPAADISAAIASATSPPREKSPSQRKRTQCHPNTECAGNRCVWDLRLARLRKSVDSERFTLYESVLRALDVLFRATCPKRTQVAASKSLLAMCLRRVPAYIGELDEWGKKDAEARGTKSTLNDSEISFEVYTELELFGTAQGWRQLCLVARAHGIRLIQDAVLEDLLEDDAVGLIIQLCLEHVPQAECSGLIDSYIYRQYPDPTSMTDSFELSPSPALQPLKVLGGYSHGNANFILAKLADLLENGFLPPTWLLTKQLGSIMSLAISLIASKRYPCRDAAHFIGVAIKLLGRLVPAKNRYCTLEDKSHDEAKAQDILAGVIAALTSMVLLAQKGRGLGLEHRYYIGLITPEGIASLSRQVELILMTCIAKASEGRRNLWQDIGIYLLNLGLYLSFENTQSALTTLGAAWNGARDRKDTECLVRLYDATLALAGAAAHNCSRGMDQPGIDHLSAICNKLEIVDIPNDALENLRTDGAFYLAERSGNLRDLAFAESLRAKVTGPSRKPGDPQPARGDKEPDGAPHAGFHWDEDIGEWVTMRTSLSNVLVKPPRRLTRTSSGSAGLLKTAPRKLWGRAGISKTVGQATAVRRHGHDDNTGSRNRDNAGQFSDQTPGCPYLGSENESDSNTSECHDDDNYASEAGETASQLPYTPDTETSSVSEPLASDSEFNSPRHATKSKPQSHRRAAIPISPTRSRPFSRVPGRPLDGYGFDSDQDDEDDGADGELAPRGPIKSRDGESRASSLLLRVYRVSGSGSGPGSSKGSKPSSSGHGDRNSSGQGKLRKSASLLSLLPARKRGANGTWEEGVEGMSSEDELSFDMAV